MVWWGFYEEVMKTHDRANPTWSHANPISLNHRWLWVWRISKKYSCIYTLLMRSRVFWYSKLQTIPGGIYISYAVCLVWRNKRPRRPPRYSRLHTSKRVFVELHGARFSTLACQQRQFDRSWSKTASQANPFNFWTMILSTYPDSRLESNEPVPLVS